MLNLCSIQTCELCKMSGDPGHTYMKAGLKICSELHLPELLTTDFEGPPDVEIRYAAVPKTLPGGVQSMPEAQAAPGAVLLTIPGVGRYHVLAGKEVRIEPFPDAKIEDVRLFLLGSAFGAIYLQRNHFPLHASVVVIAGKAVAFAGDSGAGKSTMAAWMNRTGYPLLCDDVCVIQTDEDPFPMAFPAYPQMKLWKDALRMLELETSGLRRDFARTDKFHLPIDSPFASEPVPLRQIFFLRYSDDASVPSMADISPSEAVPLLRNNTYRYQFISGLGLTEKHFRNCISIANSVPAHFLDRPRKLDFLADCQRLVEEQLA